MAKKKNSPPTPSTLEAPKVEKLGKFDKYEVQSALDSIKRAEQIKSDPDLLKEVKKLAKKEMGALKSLSIKSSQDIRDQYAKKYGRVEDEEDEAEDA